GVTVNGMPQQQNHQDKWANRGSRKPGSNVEQPQIQQTQTTNGQQPSKQNQPLSRNQNNLAGQKNGVQQPGGNDQSHQQKKWDWTKNKQSRQPGAPVQSHDNLQQVPQLRNQPSVETNQAARRQNNQQMPIQTDQSQGQPSQNQSKWQNQTGQPTGDWQTRQQ